MSRSEPGERKRIALIGSSGGGAATLGHTNPVGFVDILSQHFEDGMDDSDVQLAFVLFVSTNDGSGMDGAKGKENVSLLYMTTTSQDTSHGTLECINEQVKSLEEKLAKDIQHGIIDGLISVSCKPSLFKNTFQAASNCKIPVTGTGGSSLSEASSTFKLDLIGNAGGSVATTAETKAISFASAFARHWRLKYSPHKANKTRKAPAWKSVLNSCLPAFWGVCLLKRVTTTRRFAEFVHVNDALLIVLEEYALPVVCSVVMATSRRHTESALMAAILAGTACRKTVVGGLLAGWLVTIFEEQLLYLCLLRWCVPATFINLLTSGFVGIVVATIMCPIAGYFSMASEYYRTTVLSFLWDESETDTKSMLRLMFHSFLGSLFCYGSKVGWYHSIFLPLILIEMENGDPSILGALDFLTLVLVCSGICMGVLLTGSEEDRNLAKRGLTINMLCGDFIEACYPHMEKNWIVNMGGYLGSSISATVLSGTCKTSAYLPFPISIWLSNDWSTLLYASIFAFMLPLFATLLNFSVMVSRNAKRED